MSGGELRQWARSAISQHWGALVRMGLLLLLLFLPFTLLESAVPSFFPKNPLTASLVQLLLSLAGAYLLGPYTLGICRQLMEIFHNQTPTADGAFSWFRDPLKRRQAYGTMALFLLLGLPMHLVNWAVNYFCIPPIASPGQISGAAWFLTFGVSLLDVLWATCLLPALFLQAADVFRSPLQCMKDGIALAFRHLGRFIKMMMMILLQLILIIFAYILMSGAVSSALAFFSPVLYWIGFLILIAGAVVVGILGGIYDTLCAFLLTRDILVQETGAFTLVD